MTTEAAGLGLTDVLAAHRRNGPVDDPGAGLPPAYWRVKCDGEDCHFYVEAPTYWRACAAHDEHLAEEVRTWLRAALTSPEVETPAARALNHYYAETEHPSGEGAWRAALAAAAETLGAK